MKTKLAAWFGAMVMCLVVFMAQQEDLSGLVEDRSHERSQADDLEAAQRAESNFSAWVRQQQEVCGSNSGWIERNDGSTQCTDKHGKRGGAFMAGFVPEVQEELK